MCGLVRSVTSGLPSTLLFNHRTAQKDKMAEISEEVKERANAFKDEGNEFLKRHKYGAAAEKYSAAIELFPTAIYYSNRAQALIKLESYGLAIQDANESLKSVLTYPHFSCELYVTVISTSPVFSGWTPSILRLTTAEAVPILRLVS